MGQVSISGVAYDVYGTEAGFKAYMAGRIGADDYDDAISNDRKKAMVSATRWLDRQNWDGLRTDPDTPQALEWPRTGLTNKDGEALDDSVVPTDVEEASYELALVLLGDDDQQDAVSTGSNIKRVQAGEAQVEWFKGTEGSYPVFPPQAHDLVKYWLEGHGGFTGAWSGDADSESAFDDDDVRGLGQGYA